MPARTFALPTAMLLGMVVACRDALGPRAAHAVSVSFTTDVGTVAPGQVAGANANGAFMLAVGTDDLVITRAQIVLREIEFEYADSIPGCQPSWDDACEKIEVGPLLVELPLNGSLSTQLTATVPAGTFDEIEFELEHAHDDSASERAFRQRHPEFNGLSVRVEGTFNGQPFTFVSSVRAEMEIEFNPPIVVEQAGRNITVSVDLARWFQRPDGSVIDPRTANPGGPNAGQVATNIRASFDAFGDDDRSGRRRRGSDDDRRGGDDDN